MTDILIIGSGGAGLSAALEAKKNGLKVQVLSKTYPTASQTCQAQGGINAVIQTTQDSVSNHINDTLKSAHSLGCTDTIKYMCENANETVKWLNDMGVPFSRDEKNQIAKRSLGGASNPRACYSSDYTGLKILHTLYDNCIKENIEFLNEYMLLNIIVEENTAVGVSCLDIQSGEIKEIFSKNILIATGGYGGIYANYTTNSTATTGDGIAAAFKAGCELANMEFVQFHPTALKGSNILISESARGEGGYLVTSKGERFINELLPRDIVSRSILEKINQGEDIFLDLRHLGLEKIKQTIPQEYDIALEFAGIEIDKELIPVTPAAHYTMGGIKADINGKTSVKNIYAAGEASCNGVHGANRLGGNSLLEIITFGRKTAKYIAENINQNDLPPYDTKISKDKENIKNIFESDKYANIYEIKDRLGEILFKNAGVFKNEIDLLSTLDQINLWEESLKDAGIREKDKTYNTMLKDFLELNNLLLLAKITVLSAIKRKESRGAHFRVEFEKEDIKFDKETIVFNDNGKISFKDI